MLLTASLLQRCMSKLIGFIDADHMGKDLSKCFPNLPLMKLSAFHKSMGDKCEWVNYRHIYDLVYCSKVFSFTREIQAPIRANRIITGGSGYSIKLERERESFDTVNHTNLPDEIEHIYPDYSLYGITNTAYGFLSRGCPRGCAFCHVAAKEGKRSYKVANLSEFWRGQKYIELMDPNTFACKDWEDLLDQLIDSKAYVNFNQGVDIRLMTPAKIEKLSQVKVKGVHFAWDRYEDKELITKKLRWFKEITGWDRHKVTVYILINFNSTFAQDLERVEFCKSLGFQPYIMRYNKQSLKRGDPKNALARYVNTPRIFWKCKTFEQYYKEQKEGFWR